ncbi:MAG: hypothetical protein AB1938_18055 [Myxococcota bacterium]
MLPDGGTLSVDGGILIVEGPPGPPGPAAPLLVVVGDGGVAFVDGGVLFVEGPRGPIGMTGAQGPASSYVVAISDGGSAVVDGGVLVVSGPPGPPGGSDLLLYGDVTGPNLFPSGVSNPLSFGMGSSTSTGVPSMLIEGRPYSATLRIQTHSNTSAPIPPAAGGVGVVGLRWNWRCAFGGSTNVDQPALASINFTAGVYNDRSVAWSGTAPAAPNVPDGRAACRLDYVQIIAGPGSSASTQNVYTDVSLVLRVTQN